MLGKSVSPRSTLIPLKTVILKSVFLYFSESEAVGALERISSPLGRPHSTEEEEEGG